jgi:hypothetical protein
MKNKNGNGKMKMKILSLGAVEKKKRNITMRSFPKNM